MYKVYRIINKINNHFYIGMTKQSLNKRFKSHIYSSKRKKTKFYNALLKYGYDNFYIELINEFNNKEDCENCEILYIKNEGYYNLAKGGNGGFVVQNKQDWIEKLKKARKYRKPSLGMKHSEENKKLFKESSEKYWSSQKTYNWDNIKSYSHKEAKILFGISTTHYYRLKKRFESNILK